ncbi:unnamed protein product [Amaranthus hypochondriacus]
MDRKPMKVTLIETRHVTVNVEDFKSMVQSLTGNNSSLASTPSRPSSSKECGPSYPSLQPQPQPQPQLRTGVVGDSSPNIANDTNLYMVDLDEMLQGLPLMEDLESCTWNAQNK